MTKQEALEIHTADDNLDIFDKRYQEEGEYFFCDFFDAFTEEEIEVDVDGLSQREYDDFTSELVFSEYFVAQSNEEIDDYNDDYFKQYPKPLLKVTLVSRDPLNLDSNEYSDYWFTIDGYDKVKQIIKKYTEGKEA